MTPGPVLSAACSTGDHHLCRPDLTPCTCDNERCTDTHSTPASSASTASCPPGVDGADHGGVGGGAQPAAPAPPPSPDAASSAPVGPLAEILLAGADDGTPAGSSDHAHVPTGGRPTYAKKG